MKKSNKKGFTIVELVIVIAVIAILAAVLIPTFTNVVNKANESKDMQQARNAYEEWLAEKVGTQITDGSSKRDFNMTTDANLCIKSGNYYFKVVAGQFDATASSTDIKTYTPSGASADVSLTAMDVKDGKLTSEGAHPHNS